MLKPVDIIVPVHNEALDVVRDTIQRIHAAMAACPCTYHVIIVNDGSKESLGLDELTAQADITYVKHPINRGYGSALKTGIINGRAPWIVITDADGTYPVEDIPKLVEKMAMADMVVGTRTGEIREIPLLRRFPKWVLNQLASYMANQRICDLNSGLRAFTRDLAEVLWELFPPGFSFTSTITMGARLGGYRVEEIPINYHKREGSSGIKPIRDSIRFFNLILRLGLLFAPLRVFAPIALVIEAVGLAKGVGRDYLIEGQVGNMSVSLILAGLQILLMGYLGDLIVHSRFSRYRTIQDAAE